MLKIGLAQITPVWLNQKETINKVVDYIEKAGDQNCHLVVFGEALLPGYPFWVSSTNGAQFNSDIQKDLYAHYLNEAIQPEYDLDLIKEAAKKYKIAVVLGTIENALNRGGHSLYCSLVYIDSKGEIKNVHRKLMPTYEERLVWSPGDGHGLKVFPIEEFSMGALNCWENWMPLPRTSLYAQGEDLHIAIWPGSMNNADDITKYIAKESRSFVVSVSGMLNKDAITDDIPHAKLIRDNSAEIIANGGSCIANPDGTWLIEPQVGEEGLFIAELDHKEVRKERQNFDPSGHYSRPDVTKLTVNRKRQQIADFED